MKINKLFAIFAGLSILLSACNKEQGDTTPSMTLSSEQLNFAPSASSQTIQLTCNSDWKVSSDLPGWITVAPSEGAGSSSAVDVVISVLANADYDRVTEIVFNGGTQAKKTLKVYQTGSTKATSIADVKKLMTDASGTKIPESIIIVGNVVSNRSFSNLTSDKALFVQDETTGIELFFSGNHSFDFGDKIAVKVSGRTIKKYKELFQIDTVQLDNAYKISAGTISPIEVNAKDIANYQGMYVTVKEDCQVTDADLSKTWVMSSNATSINIVAKTGETFVVRSGKYSSFGTSPVSQGSGKISGISTVYNDAVQLVFAQASDYTGLSGDRFTVETPEITSSKISVILEASQGAKVTLQNATVVATATTMPDTDPKNTFLVTDSDKQDFILVYHTSIPGIKVGDNVTVVGTMSSYSQASAGNKQQITGSTVTINSNGTYTQPEPTDITSTFDSFDPTQKNIYASFKGTYTKSGSYCNINVSGATTNTGSILTPDGVDLTGLENVPNVTFTGYYLYKTGGKYLYFILTKAEKSTDPYLTVSPKTVDVSDAAGSTTLTISSNVEWTANSDNAEFTLSPASGNGDGTITVTYPENKGTESRNVTVTVSSTSGVSPVQVVITQSKAGGDKFTKIEKIENFESGTYYMAAYLKEDSNKTNLEPYVYHCWEGTVTGTATSNSDLKTTSYSYVSEVLTIKPASTGKAVDVIIEAVTGKANTYYVKVGGKYLASGTAGTNRRMVFQDSPAEWVATNNSKGGISLTGNGVSLGSASATSNFIRSYANEGTLKYGLVFFKKK